MKKYFQHIGGYFKKDDHLFIVSTTPTAGSKWVAG